MKKIEREFYMEQALALAREAFDAGEAPVGCVIVHRGKIIAQGRNRREGEQNALAHAEIEAIDEACRALGAWRLPACELYVTLEPCPMCAGAIINARVGTVVYGAKDEKGGACGGVLNLFEERFNHKPRVYGCVLEQPCGALLTAFFERLRQAEGEARE